MNLIPENHLADYAVRSGVAEVRRHVEPPDPLRGPFDRDRHRIIECTVFRRLEYKTQVFAPSMHDHFRTRLTHTLEVAQIARCIAVNLRANEALCEAISLAHDLGHPPFGHAGEGALDEAMTDNGGFNHNAHSLRVVEYLEHPFPAFRGLNLTIETLSGLVAHATRYDRPGVTDQVGGSVEAQVASLADRIAYNIHDLEDAIGAGLVHLEDLTSLPIWRVAFDAVARQIEVKHIHAVRRLVLDAVLDRVLSDALTTSHVALSSIASAAATRAAIFPLISLSTSCDAQMVELERFLLERVYRNHDVAQADAQAHRMILELFDAYRVRPTLLPRRFAARIEDEGPHRIICDYIAGMTDRFCIAEHSRLVGGCR